MSKILLLFVLHLILCVVLHFGIKALYDKTAANSRNDRNILQKDKKIFVSIILCLFILRAFCHLLHMDVLLISLAFEHSIEIASTILITALLYQTYAKKISSIAVRIFVALVITNAFLLWKNTPSYLQDKKGTPYSQKAEVPKTPARS